MKKSVNIIVFVGQKKKNHMMILIGAKNIFNKV